MGQKLSVGRTLQSTLSQRNIPDDLCRPALCTVAKSDKVDLRKLKSLVKLGRIAPFYPGSADEQADCMGARDGSTQVGGKGRGPGAVHTALTFLVCWLLQLGSQFTSCALLFDEALVHLRIDQHH